MTIRTLNCLCVYKSKAFISIFSIFHKDYIYHSMCGVTCCIEVVVHVTTCPLRNAFVILLDTTRAKF